MTEQKLLKNLPVDEFCGLTFSDSPTPGGGSVSALVGALAASLVGMVANLSKNSELSEEQLKSILNKAFRLKSELLALVDEDAGSFDAVMTAFKLPKDSERQKEERKKHIQLALKYAAETPLKTARKSSEIFELILPLMEKGNQNAITDAMVAAMNARNAVLGSLLNVRINLSSIKDPDFVEEKRSEVEALECLAQEEEQRLLNFGRLKL